MKRVAALILLTGTTAFLPVVAHAQTTPDESVVTTVVEQDVPVNSVVQTNDNDDDGDSKAGLWGLLGLLGLAGLAGLKRKRDDDYTRPPTPSNTAPPSSSGASGTTR